MFNEREKYLELLNSQSAAVRLEIANQFIDEIGRLREALECFSGTGFACTKDIESQSVEVRMSVREYNLIVNAVRTLNERADKTKLLRGNYPSPLGKKK